MKLRRDEDANGSYEALDQFGRIKTQSWKHSGGALMDHVSYQYDYASNRTARDISSSLYATNNLDQVYGYDSLHRLKNFDEGSMSGSSIASPTKEQDWALDTLGNWNNLTEKTSGSTTLNQNRGHNNANELTTIAGASTYVGHDAAGNMTKVPKPTNWSSAYDLEFDAWNRLVRVKDGGTTVASYSYDGLHRRIVKTVGATTEQHYYNEQWQLLEVRVGTEASAARQKYVWHPYYIDALAQRFWDGNSDGDFLDANEKHFVMHDGNFNVTSVMTTGGTVFERYYYSPYGKLTVLDSNFAVDSDGLSDVANPYTYTGRQYDAESSIYQYRYRYYHAQLGRFVGRDPVGYGGGNSSVYTYVGQKPTGKVDPQGLFAIDPRHLPCNTVGAAKYTGPHAPYPNTLRFVPNMDKHFDFLESLGGSPADDFGQDASYTEGYHSAIYTTGYQEFSTLVQLNGDGVCVTCDGTIDNGGGSYDLYFSDMNPPGLYVIHYYTEVCMSRHPPGGATSTGGGRVGVTHDGFDSEVTTSVILPVPSTPGAFAGTECSYREVTLLLNHTSGGETLRLLASRNSGANLGFTGTTSFFSRTTVDQAYWLDDPLPNNKSEILDAFSVDDYTTSFSVSLFEDIKVTPNWRPWW